MLPNVAGAAGDLGAGQGVSRNPSKFNADRKRTRQREQAVSKTKLSKTNGRRKK